MDEQRQPEQGNDTELSRPDESIKDLEPDQEEGDAVKGGDAIKIDFK
jgi:hypothetical protein